MKKSERVDAICEAFGKGDIPALLGFLDPDVDWKSTVTLNELPWHRRRKRLAAATKFFLSRGDYDFHAYVQKVILDAPGELVFSVISHEIMLKKNGARITIPDEVQLLYFNAADKIGKFAHQVGTHLFWKAMYVERAPINCRGGASTQVPRKVPQGLRRACPREIPSNADNNGTNTRNGANETCIHELPRPPCTRQVRCQSRPATTLAGL